MWKLTLTGIGKKLGSEDKLEDRRTRDQNKRGTDVKGQIKRQSKSKTKQASIQIDLLSKQSMIYTHYCLEQNQWLTLVSGVCQS